MKVFETSEEHNLAPIYDAKRLESMTFPPLSVTPLVLGKE
jgi:hypothetical protein